MNSNYRCNKLSSGGHEYSVAKEKVTARDLSGVDDSRARDWLIDLAQKATFIGGSGSTTVRMRTVMKMWPPASIVCGTKADNTVGDPLNWPNRLAQGLYWVQIGQVLWHMYIACNKLKLLVLFLEGDHRNQLLWLHVTA